MASIDLGNHVTLQRNILTALEKLIVVLQEVPGLDLTELQAAVTAAGTRVSRLESDQATRR